jgi:hypothetical protein
MRDMLDTLTRGPFRDDTHRAAVEATAVDLAGRPIGESQAAISGGKASQVHSGSNASQQASQRGWAPFNVNSGVRVKLTPLGLSILRQQDEEFCALIPAAAAASWRKGEPARYEPDAEGYHEFQLWDLMHRLGPYCWMGLDVPFDTDILIGLPRARLVPADAAMRDVKEGM